jgi:hypothetical protein
MGVPTNRRLTDLYEPKTRIQFVTFTQMPNLVYQACQATGTLSNTIYIQHAVCEALARDLDLDLEESLAMLPPGRVGSDQLRNGFGRKGSDLISGLGTIEEVK